jgi:hypothetical protein
MTAAEKYVACAYLVVFLAVLAYVLIIALNIARLEQTLRMLEAAAPYSASAARSHDGDRHQRGRPVAEYSSLRALAPPRSRSNERHITCSVKRVESHESTPAGLD